MIIALRNCILIIVTGAVLAGCKEKFPLSEKECITEAEQITKYIKHSDYKKLDEYTNKYEDYQKLTAEDLKENYMPLQKALNDVKVEELKKVINRDTITINYGVSKEYIINLYITFFIIYKEKTNTKACSYTYSKEHNNNYYTLTAWDHAIRTPIKVVMPPGGVTPPPTPPH